MLDILVDRDDVIEMMVIVSAEDEPLLELLAF